MKPIKDVLIEKGQLLFDLPRKPHNILGDGDAFTFLDDLKGHPHAFLLACIMNRQMKAERAMSIPYQISQKLKGDFSIEKLASLTKKRIFQLMSEPEPLHRFVDDMSGYFYEAVQQVVHQYGGDASQMWKGKPSSATVVYRLLEFQGVGPKIATMVTNILARDFKVKFSDYLSVDISADVHVHRVFWRLGLTPKNATPDQLIYKARELHPAFPGLLDFPTWEIGREWCHAQSQDCDNCYMRRVCPSATN
jgi:endonuclease III